MTSPFRIHIADLSQTGDSRDVVVTGPAEGWGVELSLVPAGAEASGRFTLTAVGNGVVVRGSVAVPVHNTCYRCLESWDDTVEVDISEMFGDDTLEGVDYAVDGDEIDLEPLLRDELTLAMPLQPSDECDELGGDDASDQNAPPQRGESPFAVLKDFLDGES
ncbi:MAG: DUF177 domain-containing protein [Acidimicrobiia bacterium]|nr:DUF177 domain-containing protein [Acidimicrobiia bacterium]MBT8213646.1 DUF177 domain-containing protein [Acidimicrobiia bacterium]NNF70338.1 DUF177 domain-containing protein [Acidimicrobiia bacterium]NNK91732.1 DUF177 domain-containing protein [Acidimicrobiia bacterium]